MKTTEQIVKAINFRLNQLETMNKVLASVSTDVDLTHIYFENEARMNELGTLLDYIQTPENSNGETKNSP